MLFRSPPASKASPAPTPTPAGAASPLAAVAAPATDAPQAKQEAPSTKGPDPEPTQPGTVKNPPEAATAPASPKSKAATTNPSQGEDLKMDEGNFKTPDIDLAKDVFAALGSPAPATGASGQASELAPSTADSAVPPAPAKTEYGLSLSTVIGLCPVVVCVCAVCVALTYIIVVFTFYF